MKRIAVIGSINMDMVLNVEHIPAVGETIIADGVNYHYGGKGANQAIAAARLGAEVTFFGCVGNDEFADKLVDNLKKNHVFTEYIDRVGGSSGLAIIASSTDNSIIVNSGANQKVDVEYVKKYEADILDNDIIIIQNEIPFASIELLVNILHANHKIIIYNPAPGDVRSFFMVNKVDYLTPNETETELIFGSNNYQRLIEQYPNKLILTLGEKGAAYFDGDKVKKIRSIDVDVVDTTGAGDTFNGAFAYALANDKELEDAVRFAVVASGLSVSKNGAQEGIPTLEEVNNYLKKKHK